MALHSPLPLLNIVGLLWLSSSWDAGGLSSSESRLGAMLYVMKSSSRDDFLVLLVTIAVRCLTSFSVLTEIYGLAGLADSTLSLFSSKPYRLATLFLQFVLRCGFQEGDNQDTSLR